jgi:hypothetical protein
MFSHWFLQEQREEVSSMSALLSVVERASESNILLAEDYLSRTRSATKVKLRTRHPQPAVGSRATRLRGLLEWPFWLWAVVGIGFGFGVSVIREPSATRMTRAAVSSATIFRPPEVGRHRSRVRVSELSNRSLPPWFRRSWVRPG